MACGESSSEVSASIGVCRVCQLSPEPSIPYNLLVFHPQFLMEDLPVTSRRQATACLEAARDEGLERVRVGNLQLFKG
jgi:pyruvate-formate lyase-activating enzyme